MLTGKQKRYLRGRGHDLKPIIMIGKNEISDTLLQETDDALEHHELIKIKLLESSLTDREKAAVELATNLSAEVAQILGRTFLLYRKSREPKIILPK